MKTRLLSVFTVVLLCCSARGQGVIVVNPVPVTNGLTGVLADSSIVAALYYGPVGGPENSMLLLPPVSALVNGHAEFGSQTTVPIFAPGSSLVFGVRAWSAGYPSYESAVASGLPTVLVGKSILLTATIGGAPTPPPVPSSLNFPAFSIYPVPEPTAATLFLIGLAVSELWRKHSNRPAETSSR